MKQLLTAISVGCLLGAGSLAAPAGAAPARAASRLAAVSCSAVSTTTVYGGYRTRIDCTGMGMVFGYGTTVTDAQREAALLAQLYSRTGIVCSGFNVTSATGGYSVRTNCTRMGMVFGFGTTLTAAQQESRLLAQLYTETGNSCTGFSATLSGGSNRVRLNCSRGGMVFGYGSTLTDTAANARLLASLG